MGFHTYLADMITAPEAIMKYLCRMCQIHNIPVGDASTFTHSDHVPGSVNCFFSGKCLIFRGWHKLYEWNIVTFFFLFHSFRHTCRETKYPHSHRTCPWKYCILRCFSMSWFCILLLTDNHIFLVKKSKYSGEKSTRTSEVSSPFYLAMSMNVQLLQRIQEK